MVDITQRWIRSTGFIHRQNVSTIDGIVLPSGSLTMFTDTTGGSLPTATTYYAGYAAGIVGMGVSNRSTTSSIATGAGATNTVRFAIPQATGADTYHVCMSTDSGAPKFIATITETQRAAGAAITGLGVVVSPDARAPAGQVCCTVGGSGIQLNNSFFNSTNAYILPTPTNRILCAGKTRAYIYVVYTMDDMRILPQGTFIPFYKVGDGTFYSGWAVTTPSVGSIGAGCARQFNTFDVSAIDELIILVAQLTGYNAKVTMWVELV